MPLLTPTYLEANQKGHYSLSSGVSVMTGKDVTSRQPLFEATVPPVSERTNDSGHSISLYRVALFRREIYELCEKDIT